MKRPTTRWETTTGQVTGIALLFVSAGMFGTAVIESIAGQEGTAMMLAALVTLLPGAALWLWTQIGRAHV